MGQRPSARTLAERHRAKDMRLDLEPAAVFWPGMSREDWELSWKALVDGQRLAVERRRLLRSARGVSDDGPPSDRM